MIKNLLERKNIFISNLTAHKYMNTDLELFSVVRRKKSNYKKGAVNEVFPNILQQKFYAPKPNEIWCTDFTYLPLTDGSMRYNCTIIDLFDRSVVASVTGKNITSQLAVETLGTALNSQPRLAVKGCAKSFNRKLRSNIFASNAGYDRPIKQVNYCAVIPHRAVCQRQICKVSTPNFIRLWGIKFLL